mmetsp:Transcript_122902/g.274406  ORF Transcript_122902/g.274406 Transcript_122902/m.274406 type:complete len:369 (-) Transcript_122902:54-1160(-)
MVRITLPTKIRIADQHSCVILAVHVASFHHLLPNSGALRCEDHLQACLYILQAGNHRNVSPIFGCHVHLAQEEALLLLDRANTRHLSHLVFGVLGVNIYIIIITLRLVLSSLFLNCLSGSCLLLSCLRRLGRLRRRLLLGLLLSSRGLLWGLLLRSRSVLCGLLLSSRSVLCGLLLSSRGLLCGLLLSSSGLLCGLLLSSCSLLGGLLLSSCGLLRFPLLLLSGLALRLLLCFLLLLRLLLRSLGLCRFLGGLLLGLRFLVSYSLGLCLGGRLLCAARLLGFLLLGRRQLFLRDVLGALQGALLAALLLQSLDLRLSILQLAQDLVTVTVEVLFEPVASTVLNDPELTIDGLDEPRVVGHKDEATVEL